MSAGFTGQGPATLTEQTSERERPLELSSTSPYDAMIDHVLACLTGEAEKLIERASAIPALELTLRYRRLTAKPVTRFMMQPTITLCASYYDG